MPQPGGFLPRHSNSREGPDGSLRREFGTVNQGRLWRRTDHRRLQGARLLLWGHAGAAAWSDGGAAPKIFQMNISDIRPARKTAANIIWQLPGCGYSGASKILFRRYSEYSCSQ